MTTPEPAVDLELLAAFIDGRLGPADRARAIEMLAASDAAYEVFVDVVRARADTDDGALPISSARRWNRPATWWVLAPALAAAVALFMILPKLNSPSEPGGVVTVIPLIGALGGSNVPAVTESRNWSLTRGGASSLTDSARAFRLGVRTFDLQLAVSQDDRQAADRLVAEVLDGISTLQFSQVVAARHTELRRALTAAQPRDQLLADASQAEAALDELLGGKPDDGFWFKYGKWSAAAELAAGVRSRPFFQSDLTARVVSDALARAGGTQGDADILRRAADLARGNATDTDFQLERDGLRSLIKKHAE